MLKNILRRTALLLLSAAGFQTLSAGTPPERQYYELRIYHLKNDAQEQRMDAFLQQALLPALHRMKIGPVGVFKPAEQTDTARSIYVFIPFTSWEQCHRLPGKLQQDDAFQKAGADYLDAAYNDAPYQRMETILLQAFPRMTAPAVPSLEGPKAERIYELRSYESPTEKLHRNKVHMFNAGNEVGIFKRLGFNAVFYADVLAGSHQPNLMYMTSFNNMDDRNAHWKKFGSDPEWKKLSARKEYQHNVSKAVILFLHPAAYSEL